MDLNRPDAPAGESPSPRRWFRRDPIDLGDALLQGIAVLLGVLIALGIDSWRQERSDVKTVQAAITAIRNELGANADAARSHARHVRQAAAAMAASNRQDDASRPCTGYAGWGGTQMPMFTQTAYDVAVATQALSKMPFTKANAIGRAYGAQRHVQMMYGKIADMLLDPAAKPLATCVGIYQEMANASDSISRINDDTLGGNAAAATTATKKNTP